MGKVEEMVPKTDVPVVELSRDDVLRRLEEGAQTRLGMSAREMIRSYRSGQLDDPSAIVDLLVLVDMLPEHDPLFAGI